MSQSPVRKAMFKLRSQEDIQTAIRRRGAEIAAKMTDKEVFTSPEFTRYATNLADFLLRNHRLYSLEIKYLQDPSAPVAYTDGKKIFLNVGNSIAAFPKLLERRFKVNMGILFHEAAHKLFLDFPFKAKTLDTISQGKLVGNFPQDPAVADAISELKATVAKPYYSTAIAKIYANIENILSDGHDESTMKRCFPGFISECITVAGEVQMETSTSLRDMCDKDFDPYSIYSALFLQYSKFGFYKEGDPSPFTEAYLAKMSEVEGIIDSALLTDDYTARWDFINSLVVFLWPVLKKRFPENPPLSDSSSGSSGSSQNGSSGSQGGSGGSQSGQNSQGNQPQNGSVPAQNGQQQAGENGTEDQSGQEDSASAQQQLQQILDELAQAAQQAMNAAPAPVNGTEKAISEAEVQNSPSPSSNGGLAQLLQDMTKNQATSEIQKELDDAQMAMIRNCKMPLVHKEVKTIFNQHVTPDKANYEQIAKEVKPIAYNLIAQMKALFREMNESYVQHHKQFGPMIEPTEAYRPDNKFFAKKKLPDDYPDMAICLLIDQSGSMWGEKILCAQKTAIMLEMFANGIGVPIMIAGHTTDDSAFVMNIFTDFCSAKSSEARFSLGNMESLDCNRDGYAVRVCADLLSKRPEQVKLMISISDGAPNHDGYRGEQARKDINQAVKDYRRKGLLIYGAAIDKDQAVIEEIYGKGFLSIEKLSGLPKTLVRLVKQQMI